MSEEAENKLKTIKSLDFEKWTATFWLIKRKIVEHEARYSVLRVEIDEKLQERFRAYIVKQLQGKNFHTEKYDFNNGDGDDVLFTIDVGLTDFPKIKQVIKDDFENHLATEYVQLLNSWAYVVDFEYENQHLYAWRKVNAITQPKKVLTQKALFFQNHKLIDVDDQEVFIIDPRFDFFVFEDLIFIANKREFESSMNFREGMKTHATEVLAEFESMNFLSDVAPIREYVGDNLNHLRKLSSIRKSGYYKQTDYLDKLMTVSADEKWDLKIENGKIVVEPETVELLLKLLNNDRLRSPINNELFDSAAKAPVTRKVIAP
jgi:hypothetical protein